MAQTAAIEYVQLTDILERVPEDETPLVVLFDGVTDVRNFGAIARSAECAGAHGLITPLKNSAPVNAEAIRSSAGALTTIPVCRVGSVRNTLKALQAEGFQVVAATEKSRKLLYDADFRRPTVIVMGVAQRLGRGGRDAVRGRAPAHRAGELKGGDGVPSLRGAQRRGNPCGVTTLSADGRGI